MSDQIPELIEVSMIAKVIKWDNRRTVRYLRGEGMVLEKSNRKGVPWRIARSTFAITFPTFYAMFVEAYESGELTSKRGGDMRRYASEEDRRIPKVSENASEPGSI